MPTYRYINTDHSLVLRDDHVIAWDPKADAPLATQPSAQHPPPPPAPRVPGLENEQEQHKPPEVVDELQLWKDAGSPKPTELSQGRTVTTDFPDPSWTLPGIAPIEQAMASSPDLVQSEIESTAATLDNIEAELEKLQPDDVAGLKEQVRALVKGLHVMIHTQRVPPLAE